MTSPATLGAACQTCEGLVVLAWGELNWKHEGGWQPTAEEPTHLPALPDHIRRAKSCPWCSGPKNPDFAVCYRCQDRMSRGLPPSRRRSPGEREQERMAEERARELAGYMRGHIHDGSNPACVWCNDDVAFDDLAVRTFLP
jgi:hypothetical protein